MNTGHFNKKPLLVFIAMMSLATGCSWAQPNLFPVKPWTATLKIIDDYGQPVNGASISVAFATPPYAISSSDGKHWDKISGETDTNGVFAATHTDRSASLGFRIHKNGYYRTDLSYQLGLPGQNANNRNISMTFVLKKIDKPIAMYAKSLNLGMPVFDKQLGFDLMIGDWVAPYGTGINADIIFTGHLGKRAKDDSDYKLTASFPKAGDGIQEFAVPESEQDSELRSPHEAPSDGYQSEWVQNKTRRPGKPLQTNWAENRNYFFRVRTVLDHQGNVVSTHYGKIYGDFLRFKYYLDPTPNSRNIEFDPKQNLIHSLQFDEVVNTP